MLSLAASLLLFLGAANAAATDCDGTVAQAGVTQFYAHSWGIDERNTRFQPRSTLTAANASQLELKWVYGLGETSPRSLPLVSEDTIFVGDGPRGVVALDRERGCERWLSPHDGYISSALVPARAGDRPILIFNNRTEGIYAIDARSGEPVWHTGIDEQPIPWYSGTALPVGDALYVPISSMEVAVAMNPFYGCCTTSGGMAAFDLATGKKRWFLPTISTPPKRTGSHWLLVDHYGPSGAAVWGGPSYNAARQWLYFGTGQNYSHPTTDTSDAIFALDAASGEIQWRRQFTENDAYTAACNDIELNHPNCPKPTGPDVDFGAPTVLVKTRSGGQLLIAGQKSAEVHAMNPDTGDVVWSRRLGRGGIIGGVHWGLAANEAMGLLFVPISDKEIAGFPAPGDPAPGLYALDIETGEQRWVYSRASRCEETECVFGLSAAVTATNDLVVIGSMDGMLEILDAKTGDAVWSYDAWRDYESVNDVATSGGAFDAHGAFLADDLLIVVAGYGYVGRQRGGNVVAGVSVEAIP
ncbi:MAG: PQQ-binding-like beta-propeller repeat protein [Gammaproteobacteria bacterium]|nr:PQQ-binding-like beta-propeller repeat protein [Gammaproteobacteria bacterium]